MAPARGALQGGEHAIFREGFAMLLHRSEPEPMLRERFTMLVELERVTAWSLRRTAQRRACCSTPTGILWTRRGV
jgi:hypothetical protein